MEKPINTLVQKNRSIPTLRFPEFEGEWELIKLGNISTKIGSGSTPLGGEKSYQNDGVIFIRSQNVFNDALHLEEAVHISEDLNEKMAGSQVIANDILLNITGASIGRCCVVPSDFIVGNVNQHVSIVRLVKGYNPFFFQPFLSSEKGQKLIFMTQAGGGREGLNFQNIRSFKICTPTLPEQQKIANFFTAINQKISQLKRKKTLLEQYKRGVMQKLFSQQIRFKDDDGLEFPKWERVRLGELTARITEKNRLDNQNVLTISAQQGLVSQLGFFNKSVAAKNLSGYYLLRKDNFAYNKSYSAGYPMGAIKRLKLYEAGVVSTLYICFKFRNSINLSFMEHYFESGFHNREIEKVAQEGARNHGLLNIGVKDFFNTLTKLPTLPEQTKIANFLSAIDDKIQHMQKQVEQAEHWKKGLMQKMFI